MSNAEGFMQHFSQVWKSPEPEEFAALFTSDGTLFHPTMKKPIDASQVPDYVHRIKSILPDISLAVDNWAAREDVVLVEWTITATFGDEQIEWKGADRFTLQGDKAKEGVAYFDTMALWARLDPSTTRPALESVLTASSSAPAS